MVFHVFAPSVDGALRQGEIISDFTQPHVDIERLRAGTVELVPVTHPYVIVLSQECDLGQDFSRRRSGDVEHLLESILFCAADPADDNFRQGIGVNSTEWKKLRENREPRFHFLRSVEHGDDLAGTGLPELVVDFKQYFALPTPEAYYWLESSVRRCRLESPYLEHLGNRFGAYMSRVGLPVDHHVPLPTVQLEPNLLQPPAAAAVNGPNH